MDFYSGTFTIVFSAYDPFASLIETSYDNIGDRGIAETGILPASCMSPAASANSMLVYNPGTEYGHTLIRFAGKTGSSDLVIHNVETDEKCVLKAGLATADDDYIEIDSKTGRIVLVSGTERAL